MNIEQLKQKYGEIDILIATKDRHSELSLLLQSLRTQTYDLFNLLICDESQTPITQCYFLIYMFNRLKLEGHKIRLLRNNISQGVCHIRQLLNDEQQKWNTGSKFCLRLDDDCILEQDYIFKLLQVIEKGFDMATGVIPLFGHPELERENRFVRPIINRIDVNDEGEIIYYGDDCGYCYIEDEILLASNFRTNLLYKSEINKKVKYELNLSAISFREEAFFSIRAILQDYRLAVNTRAISYHLNTPSGGTRSNPQLYAENVKLDDNTFQLWLKKQIQEKGNFLREYYEKR